MGMEKICGYQRNMLFVSAMRRFMSGEFWLVPFLFLEKQGVQRHNCWINGRKPLVFLERAQRLHFLELAFHGSGSVLDANGAGRSTAGIVGW